ncbi:signal peptidase I [Lactobacillaceae bacterium L1_55_11]|nr:signal peptidase I [Lactobacillaceae bacterium L1_55_11]
MKKFLTGYMIPIAFWLTVIFFFVHYVFTTAHIYGDSMQPNLLNQQWVGVSRITQLKRGDVIIFDARGEDAHLQPGEDDYVKRIIGVPGDTVAYQDGQLFVDGRLVNQDYISPAEQGAGTAASFGNSWSLATLSANQGWPATERNQTVVPANAYFVLGDHRSISNDSRYFGFVDRSHILGQIIVPFWYSQQVRDNVNFESRDFFS